MLPMGLFMGKCLQKYILEILTYHYSAPLSGRRMNVVRLSYVFLSRFRMILLDLTRLPGRIS